MMHHKVALNTLLTDLHNKSKILFVTSDKTSYRYKIDLPEATLYFDSVRIHDITNHGKLWDPKNICLIKWDGHYNSHTTVSRDHICLTAFYALLSWV